MSIKQEKEGAQDLSSTQNRKEEEEEEDSLKKMLKEISRKVGGTNVKTKGRQDLKDSMINNVKNSAKIKDDKN